MLATGMVISRSLADWLAQDKPILSAHPATTAVFLPGKSVPLEGRRLVQGDLARSLQQVASQSARKGFYEGALAESICTSLQPEGSPLETDDFAAFHAQWVEPITATYRGYDVYELPPNTQGFTALQILKLIEGFDVTAWGEGTADYYHHMTEIVKVAFADREEWLTDPKFVDIPVSRLISQAYIDERRRLIDPVRAANIEDVPAGIAYVHPHERRSPDGDTCYFCAADRDGMVVSLIQSIYHDFGSAVMGGDTGIILQNRGAFLFSRREAPQSFAARQAYLSHADTRSRRARRSALPCVRIDGRRRPPQSQAALLTRMIDFGYDVQQAIKAPRWLMGRTWGTRSRKYDPISGWSIMPHSSCLWRWQPPRSEADAAHVAAKTKMLQLRLMEKKPNSSSRRTRHAERTSCSRRCGPHRLTILNRPTLILMPLLDYIPDGDADVLVVLARDLRRQHLARQRHEWSGVLLRLCDEIVYEAVGFAAACDLARLQDRVLEQAVGRVTRPAHFAGGRQQISS
jgi:hypothetical protein